MIRRIVNFRSFRDLNPILVGLVSVAVIGAFVALALAVGILRLFDDTYTVTATFADAAGAKGGNDVRMAGIEIGRITDIEPDREAGNVIITFEVNSGVDLPTSPNAELALTTLLGTKFIRLTGDVPAAGPHLADLPEVQRHIPIERTRVPVEILDLVSTSSRNIDATDTDRLNRLITSFADVTDGSADDIAALINGIDRIATTLNQRDAELRRLLDRAEVLTDLLADKDETLVELVDQSRQVLGLIVDRQGDVRTGIHDGDRLVTELARLVGQNKGFLDALLDTLHPVLDLVDKHQDDVDAALARVGPGAFGLTAAGGQGPWTDIYVRSVGPDIPEILSDTLGGD